MVYKNKNIWQTDKNKQFRISTKVIAKYFNKEQHLVFSNSSAKKEEESILPFINLTKESKVLDLGCGNGRWGKILINRCKKYVGVDISKKFINKLRQEYKGNQRAIFFYMPAQDYFSREKYNIILIIGLITYLNDDEVLGLANNCKKMLNEDGQIILRCVTLKEKQLDRMIYNYEPSFIKKLFGKASYQLIRRSINEELKLFKDFNLAHMQQVEGTSYTFYILK